MNLTDKNFCSPAEETMETWTTMTLPFKVSIVIDTFKVLRVYGYIPSTDITLECSDNTEQNPEKYIAEKE